MTALPPTTSTSLEAPEKVPGLRARILLAYVAKHGEPPPMGMAFADFVAGGIELAKQDGGNVAMAAAADVQGALLGVTWKWLLGLSHEGGPFDPKTRLALDPQWWGETSAKLVVLVEAGQVPFTDGEARVDLAWWAWRMEEGEVEDLPPTAELAKRWGWTLEEVELASKRWVREEGRG